MCWMAGRRSPLRMPWSWKFCRVVTRSEALWVTSSAILSMPRYWSAVQHAAGHLDAEHEHPVFVEAQGLVGRPGVAVVLLVHAVELDELLVVLVKVGGFGIVEGFAQLAAQVVAVLLGFLHLGRLVLVGKRLKRLGLGAHGQRLLLGRSAGGSGAGLWNRVCVSSISINTRKGAMRGQSSPRSFKAGLVKPLTIPGFTRGVQASARFRFAPSFAPWLALCFAPGSTPV